jgi:hypothetical protein
MDYSNNRKEFIEKFKSQQQSHNNTFTENSKMINNPSNRELRFDGRWDYLHQLSKVKQSKIEQLRQVRKQEEQDKEMLECTFSPNVHKSRFQSNIFQSQNNEENNNNNKKERISLADFISQSVIDRQANWNQKKNLKIETMKNHQMEKDFHQCYFSPKIVNFLNLFRTVPINSKKKNLRNPLRI